MYIIMYLLMIYFLPISGIYKTTQKTKATSERTKKVMKTEKKKDKGKSEDSEA